MSLPRLLAAALRARLVRRPRPFKLTLILNYACNCRCAMCSIWSRSTEGDLTAAETDRFLARSPHWSWINLSGGEILMKPGLEDIVDSLLRRCRRLYLLDFPTTGVKPRRLEELAQRILASGVPRLAVTVSLDGPRDLHERIRGAPGLFDAAMEAMRRLRNIGDPRLHAVFGFTVTTENAGALGAAVADAARHVPGIDARDFHVNAHHVSPHYYGNDRTPRPAPEEIVAALEEHRRRLPPARSAAEWLDAAFRRDLEEFLRGGRMPYRCLSLRASVFIDPFWNVYPCVTFDRPLGNLRENDFDLPAILSSEISEETVKTIAAGACPTCFTACEAYQTMLGHLPSVMLRHGPPLLRTARPGAGRRPGPARGAGA